MIHDNSQVEQEMRQLIEKGLSLGDAVRSMYRKGYGKLLLVQPVMTIGKVDSAEAKRIVITEVNKLSENGSSG